jgi:spore coat protein U-like protein
MAQVLKPLPKTAEVPIECDRKASAIVRSALTLEKRGNSMIRKTCTALAICLSVMAVSSAAFAQTPTATTTLSVSAIVGSTCNISTSAVSFGTYDPLVVNVTAPLNGTGIVATTCSNGLGDTLTLDQGLNAATGSTTEVPLRQMRSAGNVMAYFLYQNSARSTVFGNDATTGVAQTGTGLNANLTVYGQVPGAQNAAPGSYSDTVTATVTF